jgi:hypothetical protein
LAGSFVCFGLRELLDFLNNGRKTGVLEIEADRTRIRFHLDRGRIQGVYATGIDGNEIDEMSRFLPKSIANLSPVLKMTIGGRSCAEIDGFVQLLDQKVLDPRLMTKLLRFQAAMLVHHAFTRKLAAFHFQAGHASNTLHKNLPLDISLLALLVEGAIHRGDQDDTTDETRLYVRRAIRGQNLDRAGLSARHMKVLNVLSDPKTAGELAASLGWNLDEVRQVLHGFTMAELVEERHQAVPGQFVVFEPDAGAAQTLRSSLEDSDNRYAGKVVRDKLALQLLFKRSVPHTLVFSGDDDHVCQIVRQMFATDNPAAASVRRIVVCGPADHDWNERVGFEPHELLRRPCTATALFEAMDRVFEQHPFEKNLDHSGDHQSSESEQQHPLPPMDHSPIETSTAGVES